MLIAAVAIGLAETRHLNYRLGMTADQTPPPQDLPTPLDLPLEWRVTPGFVDYDAALSEMEARAHAIRKGTAGELIWLLEHKPVYTAGTSARAEDLLDTGSALIRHTGRGGEWTYHGPGQRVVYIVLDVARRGQDIRKFIHEVEGWAIASLAEMGITADRRPGFPGVWRDGTPPDKITAIGVRLTKWVSWHGMAINHSPDLEAYRGIVPCGIHDGGVTRIIDHKPAASMADLDAALAACFAATFTFEE